MNLIRAAALAAVLLASAVCCNAADSLLLSGSDEAVWLLRTSQDGTKLDLVAQPAGKDWRWIAKEVSQTPAAGTATNRQFRLLLREPLGYVVFDLTGSATVAITPTHERWPGGAAPLAAASARGLAQAPGANVIAVVPRKAVAGDGQTRPANTQPQAGTCPADAVDLLLFYDEGAQWSLLGEFRGVALRPQDRVFVTVAQGTAYLLLAQSQPQRVRLIRLTGGEWQDVTLPPLNRVVGLVGVRNQAVVVHAAPGATDQTLRLELLSDSTVQPVTRDGQSIEIPADVAAAAASFADQVALVWGAGDEFTFATIQPSGQVIATKRLEVFTRPPPDHRGAVVRTNFILATVVALFAVLILFRPGVPPKAFSLPESVRTGVLLRRLVAAVLDLLPFSIVSAIVFGLYETPQESLQEMMDHWQSSVPFAYASVASMTGFAVYCAIMELVYGATIGKVLLGIRVVGDGATPITLRQTLLRNLSKVIEISLLPIPLVLVPLFTRHQQRLGDLLAHTTVADAASLRSSQAQPPPPPPPPQE